MSNTPKNASNTFEAVFYRTYSRRREDGSRETWSQAADRAIDGLQKIGKFSTHQLDMISAAAQNLSVLPSGRWMWVGGTNWIEKKENFIGAYNCSSLNLDDIKVFGMMMNMAMMGTGTGAVLEERYISKLPKIVQKMNVDVIGNFGASIFPKELTELLVYADGSVLITVGDSRRGWVDAYQALINFSTMATTDTLNVTVDISNVREKGKKLKGFGGVSNPDTLPALFPKVAKILNKCADRDGRLTAVECCLLIDEASLVVVAGNVRRCLPETSLIHTVKGLVPIKDVQVGDMVQTPAGFRKVTNKFEQGEQNVYDVNSNGGFTRATVNHKYAVLKGLTDEADAEYDWIRLGDINENDRLLFNRKILPGHKTALPSDFTSSRPLSSTTCASIIIPDLDSDVAWFIGYTHGNGCIQINTVKESGKVNSKCSWTFNRKYDVLGDAISDRLIAAVAKFGLIAKRQERTNEQTSMVSVVSMRLAEYLQRFVKVPSATLHIPDFILQGTAEIRSAYLAGLYDSDGSQNNRPAIAVTTVYTDFAREITATFGSLGIPTRISVTIDAANPDLRPKYDVTLPSLKAIFNDRIALYSCKGMISVGKHEAHGFSIPTEMVRTIATPAEIRTSMGTACPAATIATTNVSFKQFTQFTLSDIDIPITFRGLSTVDVLPTWDIEVEGEHCFYADGYLVHNSAGMRQGGSDDKGFAEAKDNLWSAGDDGKWRIDPERDALRMANHTRVYHHRPTLAEITDAVTKQFYSGEGAIQFAPEAIARGSADVLPNRKMKDTFIKMYAYDQDKGRALLRELVRSEDEKQFEHRMSRYGLNPCFVAGTMIMTREGHFPIETLVDKVVDVWDGKQWVTVDNFRITGDNQQVVKLTMNGGETMTATPYHTFVLENGDTRQLKDLKVGDRLLTHDVQIHGTHHEKSAYLKGFLVGDGTTHQNEAALRLYRPKWVCSNRLIASRNETPTKVLAYANNGRKTPKTIAEFVGPTNPVSLSGFVASEESFLPWVSTHRESIPDEMLNWDLPSKLEFINGVMDADGSVMDSENGFGYQISSVNPEWLLGFQTLLHTIGVNSKVAKNENGGHRDFGEDKGGVCVTQPLYRMTITQRSAIVLSQKCMFTRLQSLAKRSMTYNTRNRANIIASIENAGVADQVYCCTVHTNNRFSLTNSFVTGNCAEVLGSAFLCNLSEIHLKTLDPWCLDSQSDAFRVGGWIVASLLHHEFEEEIQRYSREIDPIVGVSFTGLFDFFVNAFGLPWLQWWEAGRATGFNVDSDELGDLIALLPDQWISELDIITERLTAGTLFFFAERKFLSMWRRAAHSAVDEYCDEHNLRRPNRTTVVQPAGTKSLLTGSSPGWHPPKGANYIRRITFSAHDPLAMTLCDAGYKIIPGQTDKDETGALLDDPMDARCTEWLVEIPVQTSAGLVPGAESIDFNKFSAAAQLDFYMQVQNHYAEHTTSATIELREDEIGNFSAILEYWIGKGFMSAALLARFDSPFPRLPFEVISPRKYADEIAGVESRRTIPTDGIYDRLAEYDNPNIQLDGPAQCDSGWCDNKK